MSKGRLFLLDPYNDNQMNSIKDFENRNELSSYILGIYDNIRKTLSQEEYLMRKKNSNEITECLFIENNGIIKDSCIINAEKDISSCKITFPSLKSPQKNRPLVQIATDYALNTLRMQEVFQILPMEDQHIMTMLEQQGYEPLGEVDDKRIIYLKENSQQNTLQRVA